MRLRSTMIGRYMVALAALAVVVGAMVAAPPVFAAGGSPTDAARAGSAIQPHAQLTAASVADTGEAAAAAAPSDDTTPEAAGESSEPKDETETAATEGPATKTAATDTAADEETESTEAATELLTSSAGDDGSSGWLYFWLVLAVVAVIGIGFAAYYLGRRRRAT